MSTTQDYKPGDVVNGHVLTQDGQWIPAAVAPPAPMKKPFYRRWWFITVVVLVVLGALANSGDETEPVSDETGSQKGTSQNEDTEPAADEPTSEVSEPKADTEPEAKPEPKPAPAFDLAVQAGKLIQDFEANELAADNTYKGKTLKVTGIVDKIDTDLFDEDEYILNLTNGDRFAILTVGVYGLSQDELAKLQKGQTVTVIATFDDGGDLGVLLKDGRLA